MNDPPRMGQGTGERGLLSTVLCSGQQYRVVVPDTLDLPNADAWLSMTSPGLRTRSITVSPTTAATLPAILP